MDTKNLISAKTEGVIHKIVHPFMHEFKLRDLLQVIVGASVLAVPVAFTEEVWKLGESLPLINVLSISILSLIFISAFVYYNFHGQSLKTHLPEFFKRVIATYVFSMVVVSILLTLIQKAPWGINNLVAIKRILLVSFPASMSAAVSDMLK